MVDYGMVRNLYRRGLVYFNIPISDEDFIVGESGNHQMDDSSQIVTMADFGYDSYCIVIPFSV